MTDIVLPYVNGADPLWRRDYMTRHVAYSPERFRDWGMLRYVLRSYAENMPWGDVLLVVSRESQLPEWYCGRYALHSDFIPAEYLPCFNVNTIEDYLWNLPCDGRIVYTNDDIVCSLPVGEDEFFHGGAPRVDFAESDGWRQNVFRRFVRTGLDIACDGLGVERYDMGKLLKPSHSMTPICRWQLDAFRDRCMGLGTWEITTDRESRNVNQYVYSYIALFSGRCADSGRSMRYMDLGGDMDAVCAEIADPTAQVLCLNDNERVKSYETRARLLADALSGAFPNACRYERG